MDYNEIIKRIRPELEKTISFLEKELGKIRSGRATTALVEDIVVDCFGQKLPLKQLGAITLQPPRQIVIQPWDKSYFESIEKAVSQAGSGLSAVTDKDVIRINIPSLTEEYRKELLRLLSEKQEETRRTIRKWREDAWKEVQERQRTGEIREDDKFRAKDKLQEIVDEFNGKIEELGEKKKKEITD